MRNKIKDITASEILDSRGKPTLRVNVITDNAVGTFDVPSGASTGKREAIELRDGGERLGGKGVLKAVANAGGPIKESLMGVDVEDQKEIDSRMIGLDGTENKSNLGANAIVGVSIAAAKAAALGRKQNLWEYLRELAGPETPNRKAPLLYVNLVNGGKHSHSGLSFQEYYVIPMVETISEAVEITYNVQQKLIDVIIDRYGGIAAGICDEGGHSFSVKDAAEPLHVLASAVKKSGYEEKVKFGMDVAATSFCEEDKYLVEKKVCNTQELRNMYMEMTKNFPILSIEDPFQEEDFTMFTELQKDLEDIIIIADDLTVTNTELLQKSIDLKSAKGVIIKPNQVGTLTETLDAMRLAWKNDIKCIVSHRSGETNDSFISDLAYGLGSFGMKPGALRRGERVAKYNRLLEIAK